MARYRPIFTKIWKDPTFQKYTPNQKLLFVYFVTNQDTSESGIYPLSLKTISDETGLPMKTVRQTLEKGLKNVSYDFKSEIVFVQKFLRYNGRGRPELIQKSIENDFDRVPTSLWRIFAELYPAYSENLNLDHLPPHTPPSNTNTNILYTNEVLDNTSQDLTKAHKIKHLDCVYLTKGEVEKLNKKYSTVTVAIMIGKLNNYKMSNGRKYKSDYFAILNWVADQVLKEQEENGNKKPYNPDDDSFLHPTQEG